MSKKSFEQEVFKSEAQHARGEGVVVENIAEYFSNLIKQSQKINTKNHNLTEATIQKKIEKLSKYTGLISLSQKKQVMKYLKEL